MLLYFAYGANLDRAGMAQRCPASTALGRGRLDGWRFIIMAEGYATVLPDPDTAVHGLLWRLADTDVPALDVYEELDTGLYRRKVLRVRDKDDHAREAAVYLAASTTVGVARPGYMEAVLAAAEACGLPPAYLAELRTWRDPR